MPIYEDLYYDGPPAGYENRVTPKRYVALHSTQNDASARGEAAYAKDRDDNVSSHYYGDDEEVVQSLDTDLIAWHAGSEQGNEQAISYEITGMAQWDRATWLANVDWQDLARQVRRDCKHHDIAVRDLSVSQIKDGEKTGLITHNEMRLAWGGTSHWDPGPDFPIDHLIALVKGEEPATVEKPGGTAKRPAPGPEIAFPLPSGYYFGPREWGNRSVSGYYGRRFRGRTDRQWLQEWVRQLRQRGWPAGKGQRYLRRYGSDGLYGDEHAELIRAFQRDQGLRVDGLLGVRTWTAAYRNPVT